MNIINILLIMIIIYLNLLYNKKNNKEKFTINNDDKIISYIKNIYNTDVYELRKLYLIIEQILPNKESLNLNCKLTVTGNFLVSNNVYIVKQPDITNYEISKKPFYAGFRTLHGLKKAPYMWDNVPGYYCCK